MKDIEFESGSAAPAFEDRYVAEVETEVGVKFPASFLALMRTSNGGKPRQGLFDFDDNEKIVERFLSFVEDYKVDRLGMYDIEVVWSQIEDRLDEGVCPFASVFAGDFLCFDCRHEGEPSVALWGHDVFGDGIPELVPVADTFEQFLDMLRE
jgi:hypothetical protein